MADETMAGVPVDSVMGSVPVGTVMGTIVVGSQFKYFFWVQFTIFQACPNPLLRDNMELLLSSSPNDLQLVQSTQVPAHRPRPQFNSM